MSTQYVYNEVTGEFEVQEISAPRIVYFQLRDNKAFMNSPCTIEWEVTDASSVRIEGVSGEQPLRGFLTFRPAETTMQWTLRAIGEGESVQTLEIQVFPLPQINMFTVQPVNEGASFIVGDSVKLLWDAAHYDTLKLNNEDVTGLVEKHIVLAEENTEFTLVAHADNKTFSKQIQISAYPCPKINITASKTKLKEGKHESSDIEWNVENAQSVSLIKGNGSTNVRATGKETVSPSNTTVYKIVATARDGERKFPKSIEVKVIPEAVIVFTANHEFTLPHVPIVLSWEVAHGKSAKLIGNFEGAGDVPLNGNIVIELDSSQRVTLQITDEFETKEKSLTIKMLPIPRMELRPPTMVAEVNISAHMPVLTVGTPLTSITGLEEHVMIGGPPEVKLAEPVRMEVNLPDIKWFPFRTYYGRIKKRLEKLIKTKKSKA